MLEEIKEQLKLNPDLALLKDCPFLLLNKGNRVRTIADEMFEEAQFNPEIILETENIETVMALASKGMGITFYPKMFISSLDPLSSMEKAKNALNINFLNFYHLNYPKANGVLAIGYHKGHYLSQATKEFIRIAKEKI